MKKQILTLGMMCAAAFALTNCDKQSTDPQLPTEGTPFEIIASTVDTKTANDGLKTEWTEKDSLNVFHAVTGTSNYGTNDKFTWTGTDNKFSGELTEALESESYDWYALYPYNSHIETPGERTDGYTYIGHSKGVNQQGNNSTAHLCKTLCPLYGVAKGVDSNTSVNLTLKHLASVVKIVVKNSNDADLTVSSITFTAEEDIVGSYFIDITKSPVVYTPSADKYVYKTEVLNVKNGTPIAKDESAEFYIPIKPFTAASGSTLKISVNGYEKPLTMPKDITFEAGQIKEVAFVYDKEETPTPDPSDYATTYTSNTTFTAVDNASDAKVNIDGKEYDAMKVGTSKKGGSMSVTVPAGTTKLHIHAVGWKGKTPDIAISGATVSPASIKLSSDTGISNNTPFTLTGDAKDYYYELSLSDITAETTLTFTSENARFVIFGVNAE